MPEFAPRDVLAGKHARALARDLLAMSQDEFSAAFKGLAHEAREAARAGAQRAAVSLGNSGAAEEVSLLEDALAHDEPPVRKHAAWALEKLRVASPEA